MVSTKKFVLPFFFLYKLLSLLFSSWCMLYMTPIYFLRLIFKNNHILSVFTEKYLCILGLGNCLALKK